MKSPIAYALLLILSSVWFTACTPTAENEGQAPPPNGPYMATGIKIGEVSDESAIIWTRLTKVAERVGDEAPFPEFFYKNPETGEWESGSEVRGRPDREAKWNFPEGYDIETIEGATPGTMGEVRVLYQPEGGDWQETPWQIVDSAWHYTRQFKLDGLRPNTRYQMQVLAKPLGGEMASDTVEGHFRTAPMPDVAAEVDFALTTCTGYDDRDSAGFGYKIYPQMLKQDPDFFVHLGDILYYDDMAKTRDLALWHWERMYSLPSNRNFHRQVASYFIKDDHDTWMNDCWETRQTRYMGDFTYDQGLAIFPREVPMGDKTYRTFRWGKDVQIWLVEGRDFRSPNDMPDGPDKTIWGETQMEWFKSTVQASDAAVKFLLTPTPVVGPDRKNKKDNHSNEGFAYEGKMLREFIAQQGNLFVICGDRHWQYVSKDDETGVIEFGTGSASDEHAGGWGKNDVRPEHLYLNVIGGFMTVNVARENDQPVLTVKHFGVNGEVLNQYRQVVKQGGA